jgi:hypothetical protein
VTYDLYFFRVPPGRTYDEVVDERNAAFDPDAEPEPMNLTDDHRAVWARIVDRVSREVGPATSEEFAYNLTLIRSGPAGTLQLDYDGESAAVYIAYRYPGPAALPIMWEAYRVARLVEEESGLEGRDDQVDQTVRTGDVEAAAAKLGGTSRWAQDTLTR